MNDRWIEASAVFSICCLIAAMFAVEVVLSLEEAEALIESLDQARLFAGATYGDSDG